MNRKELVDALSASIPKNLCEDLVNEFLQIRQDLATGTVGRTSPGKFVETIVQILEHLENGTYSQKPNVDEFLRNAESRASGVDDGLRICATRVARAMYSLRSKRNIAHKGPVDPNRYDLAFLTHGSQWIMAELLRVVTKVTMEEAGRLISIVQAPVGGLVEDFPCRRLVLPRLGIEDELLVLLHSYYPDIVPKNTIFKSLNRRSSRSVENSIRSLWLQKLIEGDARAGYKLTQIGFQQAVKVIADSVSAVE